MPAVAVLSLSMAAESGAGVGRARSVVAAMVAAGAQPEERPSLAAIAVHESRLSERVARCEVAGLGGAVGLWQRETRSEAERARLCAGGVREQARVALRMWRECVRRGRVPPMMCYAGRTVRDRAVVELEGMEGRMRDGR